MVFVALSFIAGIAACKYYPYFPVSISAASVLTVLALFLIPPRPPLKTGGISGSTETKSQKGLIIEGRSTGRLEKWRPSKSLLKRLLIILIFFSGFVYSSVRQSNIPEYIFPKEDLHVAGAVAGIIPECSEEKVRFTIDRVSVNGHTIRGKISLTLYQKMFKIPLSSTTLSPGDWISATARLRRPTVFRNPGVYAYDPKTEGIVAAGYVKRMTFINGNPSHRTRILQVRQKLSHIIEKSLSRESAAFHKALIPGLKGGIPPGMREAFSAAGLAHLLSISGTHFGLLAFISFQTIRRITLFLPEKILTGFTLYITPSQAAVLCTVPVLGGYAFISGMSTPTVRSLIMVLIYMLALFLGRRGQWLNSLSIAAVIILIYSPDALFELSFGLSFMAVFFIGSVLEQRPVISESEAPFSTFQKRKPEGIQKIYNKLKISLLLTTAAVFGTAPLSITVFHQFPLIAPAANLVVTPLVCFAVLPLGFASGFAALIFNMQTLPFSAVTELLTKFALLLVHFFSNIPYANIPAHSPPVILIAAYYLSWILYLKWRGRWNFILIALTLFLYLAIPFTGSSGLRITFLDVGQGDAAVIELPDSTVMLIDGGPEDGKTGQRVIAPVLYSKGIRTIDYLVISHAHPDHLGGLHYILDHFEIREVWAPTTSDDSAQKFFYRAAENGISIMTPVRGNRIRGQGFTICILHPYDEFHPGSPRGDFSDENSHSLVLKIESGDVSVLFTGDIEEEAEKDLLYLGKWLKSDIIKVPHHGGRTSSTESFLKAVDPDIAVVSAGRNNPFHHPHHQIIERYNQAGVKLFRTDRDGAITISGKVGSYEVSTYEDNRLQKASSIGDEIRNLRLLFL